MRKHDLRLVDRIAREYGVDRIALGDYIHDLKQGIDGNPDLIFYENGDIYVANEPLGSVYDVVKSCPTG